MASGGIEYGCVSCRTMPVGPTKIGTRSASSSGASLSGRSRGRSSAMRSSGMTPVAREGRRVLTSWCQSASCRTRSSSSRKRRCLKKDPFTQPTRFSTAPLEKALDYSRSGRCTASRPGSPPVPPAVGTRVRAPDPKAGVGRRSRLLSRRVRPIAARPPRVDERSSRRHLQGSCGRPVPFHQRRPSAAGGPGRRIDRRRERFEQVHLQRVGAGGRGAGDGERDDEPEDGGAEHGRLAPREQANGGGHAAPPRWRMRGSITEYETSTSRLTRT